MKQITNKTILKQNDKEFQPVEVDGAIYWVDREIEIKQNVWYYSFDYNCIKFCIEIDKEFVKNALFFEKGSTIFDYSKDCGKIIAQSQPKLEGIPVISLDSYVEFLCENEIKLQKKKYNWHYKIGQLLRFFFRCGYKSNPNQYTKKDIEKAIELARMEEEHDKETDSYSRLSKEGIIEQINSISIIEVDEQFNIISYE